MAILTKLELLFALAISCRVLAMPPTSSGQMADYTETVVVSMRPGAESGRYIYRVGAGLLLTPRCFAIDPNDKSIYIPETDIDDNIRVHHFDAVGKFKRTLELEGEAGGILGMAVTTSGDMLLNAAHSLKCTITFIAQYDRAGRFLRRFGTYGPISGADIIAEHAAIAQFEGFPGPDKYFADSIDMILGNQHDLYVVAKYAHPVESATGFDLLSGAVTKKFTAAAQLPNRIAATRLMYFTSVQRLTDLLRKEDRRMTSKVVTFEDDVLYYMVVATEYLEIRRLEFVQSQ